MIELQGTLVERLEQDINMNDHLIAYREYRKSDIMYIRDILEFDLGYNVPLDELNGRINEMISGKNYKIFVACDEEKVIGFVGMVSFIAFEVKNKAAKITALAVSQEYRRKGIGSNLLNTVENYCKSQDVSVILLNSGLSRELAHKFYESMGYSKKSYGFIKQVM